MMLSSPHARKPVLVGRAARQRTPDMADRLTDRRAERASHHSGDPVHEGGPLRGATRGADKEWRHTQPMSEGSSVRRWISGPLGRIVLGISCLLGAARPGSRQLLHRTIDEQAWRPVRAGSAPSAGCLFVALVRHGISPTTWKGWIRAHCVSTPPGVAAIARREVPPSAWYAEASLCATDWRGLRQ